MAAYDLHIHSGYSSDGELPVAAIVGLCAARGLDAFSLTDHNSVRGVGEAARLARERGIGFVPGIEIDCNYRGTDLPCWATASTGVRRISRGWRRRLPPRSWRRSGPWSTTC